MKKQYDKFAGYWLIISMILLPAILIPIIPSSASSSDELADGISPELMCWTEEKYDILVPLATRIVYFYRPTAISGSAYVVYVNQPYYFSYYWFSSEHLLRVAYHNRGSSPIIYNLRFCGN